MIGYNKPSDYPSLFAQLAVFTQHLPIFQIVVLSSLEISSLTDFWSRVFMTYLHSARYLCFENRSERPSSS